MMFLCLCRAQTRAVRHMRAAARMGARGWYLQHKHYQHSASGQDSSPVRENILDVLAQHSVYPGEI